MFDLGAKREKRTPVGRERQIVRREKKSIKEVREERKMNKKIINHMPFGVCTVPKL